MNWITIGGFVKTALRQTMLRDPNIVIMSGEEMVTIIKRGLDKSLLGSEKYSFVHIEAVPSFEREEVSAELPVKGIQSLHSFSMLRGGILASKLSCHACTVSSLCDLCKDARLTVSAEEVEAALEYQMECMEEEEEAPEVDFENEDSESEDDDGSEVVSSEESEDCDEELDFTDPGSIVWVLWGRRRYPAKVILLSDVPETFRNSFRAGLS